MTDSVATEDFPTGEVLEAAIVEAKAGRLDAVGFAAALTGSTLMAAVVDRSGSDADTDVVSPLVFEVDGVAYGAVFTAPQRFESFGAQTPFVLLAGADLGLQWPTGLGLAINPGAVPAMLIASGQLAGILGASRADADRIPRGSALRVGPPDPGLPVAALELLQRLVRSDPTVVAAYQLALAVDDGPIELAVGVEPSEPGTPVAQTFAARVQDADAGFRGLAFLDLDGDLLRTARRSSPPLA